MTHHERRLIAHADLDRLNADELEAVHYLITKCIAGAAKHGPLALATDRRNWTQEIVEELADAAFYGAFAVIQRQRRTAPPVADLVGLMALAAREAVPARGPARHAMQPPDVLDDAYWQRHPVGSPERVQAVEEHNAAKAVAK